MEQTVGTLSVRVDKLEKDVCELFDKTNSAAVMQATVVTKLDSVLVTIGEIKSGLSDLQSKPGKRWEGIVSAILAAICAGGVGFIIAQILK